MKLTLPLLSFLILLPITVAAQEQVDAKKAECVAFYDEKKALNEKALKPHDNLQVKKLEDEGKIQEAYELALRPYYPLFEILEKSQECGPHDDRYYEDQSMLCRGYLWGSNEWREFFKLQKKPFPYCKEALERGDARVLMEYVIFYLRGDATPKNYKKAIEHINDFAKADSENEDVLYFATPIYRRGGYGIEKDESKAFEILLNLAKKFKEDGLLCELSLYYENGIGTSKNEQEAEKWLKIYKGNNPDKECEFADFDFMFESSPLEKALLEESVE